MKNSWGAVLLICVLSGCETRQASQQSQEQSHPVKQPHIVHTFTPLPYTGGNLAFDHATGQKCRTWDWDCGCYAKILEAFNRKTAKVKINDDRFLQLALERDKLLAQCDETEINGMRCLAARELPTCDSLQKGTE